MIRHFLKSPSDKNLYKLIILPNKLRCLLISDSDAEKSAAAVSVGVGSYSDPKHAQGLAHFLEHMLFMGTEKYPNENAYMDYIAKNGGHNNAYTASNITNYFFDCSNYAFEGGIERLAQFFISPLLNSDCINREINAVHSEYKKNIKNDAWRQSQLFRNLSHKDSFYNGFSTGNLTTLQIPTIRKDLLLFHQKWYSANLMRLVLYGSESLNTLEEFCKSYFNAVPNFNTIPPDYTKSPKAFTSDNLGQMIKVIPVTDTHSLTFSWHLSYLGEMHMTQPDSYLSALFGYEGENSLTSLLVEEGLITSLYAGFSHTKDCFSFMQIHMDLTDKGINDLETVIEITMEFIKRMSDEGFQQYFFNDLQSVGKLSFQFKKKISSIGTVRRLASRMHSFEDKDIPIILQSDFFPQKENSKIINQVMNDLRSDNLLLTISSKIFENDQMQQNFFTDPHYGTRYTVEKIPSSLIKRMRQPKTNFFAMPKPLGLPPRNIFIPKNLRYFGKGIHPHPVKIYNGEYCHYHKKDDTFELPRSNLDILIHTMDCGFPHTLESRCFVTLWLKITITVIRELLYMAGEANVGMKMFTNSSLIGFSLSGLGDSIELFLPVVLREIRSIDMSAHKKYFDVEKEQVLRELKSIPLSEPFGIISYELAGILNLNNTSLTEVLGAYTNIHFDDFLEFNQNWLQSGHITVLTHGNWNLEGANKTASVLMKALPLNAIDLKKLVLTTSLKLPDHSEGALILDHGDSSQPNSAVLSFFQFDPLLDMRERMLASVLEQFLQEPTFDQLRTKEQLGYMTSYSSSQIGGYFAVQSDTHAPEYIVQRINQHLDNMRKSIHQLTGECFQVLVKSVETIVTEKYKNGNEEAIVNRAEVLQHRYEFNWKANAAVVLDQLTKNDLISFFEVNFFEKIRRIDIEIVSADHHQEQKQCMVQNCENNPERKIWKTPIELKQACTLFSDYRLKRFLEEIETIPHKQKHNSSL